MKEVGLTKEALSYIVGKMARRRGGAKKETLMKMVDDIAELERLGEKYGVRFEPAQP